MKATLSTNHQSDTSDFVISVGSRVGQLKNKVKQCGQDHRRQVARLYGQKAEVPSWVRADSAC